MGLTLRSLLLCALAVLCRIVPAGAADLYWAGGAGNWHDAANWSFTPGGKGGAGTPAAGDDVFISEHAFTAAGQLITLEGAASCRSFTWNTASGNSGGITGKGNLTVTGNFSILSPVQGRFGGTFTLRSKANKSTLQSLYACSGTLLLESGNYETENAFYFDGEVRIKKATLELRKSIVAMQSLVHEGGTLRMHDASLFFTGKGFRTSVPAQVHADKLQINGKTTGNDQVRSFINDQQSPLTHGVTTVVVPNPCNGQCVASATAVVTGGSGSFSYQWSTVPAQFTPTATNLCAGTYLVVVTDLINGDQVPAFAIVTDPPPLVIFFQNTSPLCNGVCNGSSSATVAGGTPPYSYLWSPGNQTTSSISNQCAGTYTLQITDANNCQTTQISVITQPAVLVDNGTNIDVTCFGLCDGTALVAPTGGTAPYSFVWAPGGQTTPAITLLCPGSYTCTITDVNGCTDTYVATITQPNPLQVALTPTSTSCFNVCDGSITSTVSGGTPPYSYSWSPGGQTTPGINNQCAGTYTLNVTDANGCTMQQVATITQPPQLTAFPTGVNITCYNACNGTAAANAAGGTPPYTYSWAPSGGTGPTASNLCPGVYTVTVTDANGCTTSGQVSLTQPLQLLANVTNTDITCFGLCNGSATSNTLGGTAPYTYSWAPSGGNGATASNLCPGNYTVTVTDANGCTATGTAAITQPTQLQTNATSTNVSCFGACDGSANAIPGGGTPPYSYLWMPGGQTTANVSGLCPGTYTLTVTDANGCTRNQTITITQPNPLNVTINSTQIPCNNSCNATMAAVVTGGTVPFTYQWLPGGQTTSSITNQCAGSYSVIVTDANNCTDTAIVTITQPTALLLAPSFTAPSCNGSCDGSATVAVVGGTPTYSYSWAPGGQTTATISNICAGTYTVTVTDINGCTGTATIIVTEPLALQPQITTNNVTCNGSCNGTASANPVGGTAPYTYLWSPGGQTTSSVNGLCAGTYTCTVTDAQGCSINQTISITQPPPLLAVVSATTSSCGICNGTATINVSGGVGPYAYFWTPSGGTNPTATGLCVGTYTCTVTDAQGCTTTTVANINQVVNIVITSSQTNLSCFNACDGVASANAAGGTAPYTYLWQPGGQTTPNVTNLCPGSYTVTVTDAVGCFNTSTITFNNPAQIIPTVTTTDAACNSNCNGTASVNATGGTGTLTYLWQPGGQTTASITGLCAGSYSVTVTDANGCDTTVVVTINEPSLIQANEISSPANCTLCDGSITTSASGGSGPYTYSWAPGGQTTSSITNLCPGIYTVTITDNTGCSEIIPIAVSNLNGPTVQATFTNATCNGVCDGTATATVTNGTAPFTYDWSPGNPPGDGTPAVTALCAGTYFVQVTDGVGCITFTSVNITEPAALTVMTNISNASCFGICDGSIALTPMGGTGPYTYLWSPGGQTTSSISGLCAGTYTVDITDANGCTLNATYTITEPVTLGVSLVTTNIVCNAACNGQIQATTTGGTSPFFYSWSSGQITSSIANMCPGTYTLTVTDVNGCSTQQQATLTEPPALQTFATSTDATCFGLCDGTGSVTVIGGTPGYTYLWSPGSGTTPTASGLCAGAYSITTSDTNGCTSVQSVTINQPPSITTVMNNTSTSCFGACDGTAGVVASGGNGGFTYSWAPGGQTTTTITGLCIGTYTVSITDAGGCVHTNQTTVTQPALLQANATFTSPSCNGACDGTATANPVGGTAPYSYLWAPGGQNTQSISALCAGTYTVTVRDANNCQYVQVVNVTPVAAIALAVASSPASCGSCDGTISVTPSGGTGPYNYTWSGGLPPQANQTNVCAGLYTVTVTDANGCGNSFTIPINNNGGPTGETVTTIPATCSGTCNGSATVTPVGGTPPYTYLWIPGGQTVDNASGLCAGNYFVQVTDANGCIRFSPVVITEPSLITGNPFVINATCTGICDGSISLTPAGGTGPYTYSWAPGGQTTSAITNQCTGSYSVTITDVTGCSQTITALISPWNSMAVNATASGPLCGNSCNGSASAIITGGNAPFTYLWNDPLAQVSQTANGLCAGTYTVVVTDSIGCNASVTAVLTATPPLQINPNITATTCGQCNGTAALNASGGTAPYTYNWSNGGTTQNLSGLCAGVYSVIVTDATGCSASFTITVTSSNSPAANLTSANASCAGVCDGTAQVAPTGGTAPYTINWLPGGQTTTSVNNLCAGNYQVQVMDSTGCIATTSFVITEPAAITANQQIVQTDCGQCNGSITLAPAGGTGPYTYSWAPGGQTTAAVTNLCAGLYTVTITDAGGCSEVVVIPVSNVNSGMALTTGVTSVNCFGACNGTANVSVSGGVAPFTFAWSNGNTNDTITALCAGTYFVQVTDANGCVSTAQAVITEPAQLALSFANVVPESCPGSCNGSITAIASGGTLNYSYTWSNSQTGITATGLCAGSYTVTVSDANGCTAQQVNAFVAPQVLVLSAPVITSSSCNNTADGAIDITVNGGTPPYTFQWNGPSGFTASTEDLSAILSGTYTVIITDAGGCQATDTITVISTVTVQANAGNDTTFCAFGVINLDGGGSANATSYQWLELPGFTIIGNTVSVNVTPSSGTTTYLLVAYNGGCSDTDTVIVTSAPQPTVDAGNSVSIIAGGSAVIGGNPTGPLGSTYSWGPANGLGDPISANPTASPSVTTTYTVTVTNSAGCSATDTVTVNVLPEIAFPNGFTPNGDGTNDVWVIDNIQLFRECVVEVYNRWGEMLFRSVGYNTPWDGRYNGAELPVGTYYYVIDLNDPLFPTDYTGPITIMR